MKWCWGGGWNKEASAHIKTCPGDIIVTKNNKAGEGDRGRGVVGILDGDGQEGSHLRDEIRANT